MKKADRDHTMGRMSQQERNKFRAILRELRSETKVSSEQRYTLKEVLESRKGEFSSELCSALEAVVARDEMGPKVGEQPPDFFLKRLETKERVRLSDFRERQPVAIVFGSYT